MLMRFDPFRDLDRLTDQVWGGNRTPMMPMDAHRHGDEFVVQFDLPGVSSDSIELTVEKNVLTVGAHRARQEGDGVQIVASERPMGSFRRQLFLGEALDTERVQATYDSGVLTVRVPVAEHAKPRKVAIDGGDRQEAIETSSA